MRAAVSKDDAACGPGIDCEPWVSATNLSLQARRGRTASPKEWADHVIALGEAHLPRRASECPRDRRNGSGEVHADTKRSWNVVVDEGTKSITIAQLEVKADG